MIKKVEKYLVSEEIIELFDSARASRECRDKVLNSMWGTGRAIEYGRKAVVLENKAWSLVWKLYPELVDKHLQYLNIEKKVVIITNK